MKTAVLLSGESRTFRDCFPSLNACVLSQNKCDIFLHVYEDENTEDVLKIYSPKRFLVEDKNKTKINVPKVCESSWKEPGTDVISCLAQWRNVQKAFELIDEQYECVIKTRYDIKYTNPLLTCSFDMERLNVPSGGDWRGGLFDMFAFGSYTIMKRYCSLYSMIETYCEAGIPYHSEILNRVNNKNTQINRFDYTIILRKRYDKPFPEDRIFSIQV